MSNKILGSREWPLELSLEPDLVYPPPDPHLRPLCPAHWSVQPGVWFLLLILFTCRRAPSSGWKIFRDFPAFFLVLVGTLDLSFSGSPWQRPCLSRWLKPGVWYFPYLNCNRVSHTFCSMLYLDCHIKGNFPWQDLMSEVKIPKKSRTSFHIPKNYLCHRISPARLPNPLASGSGLGAQSP